MTAQPTDPEDPEAQALAHALQPLTCANGFIFHGEVLAAALPHVAAAIIDQLTDRGWRPPPAARPDDHTDHVHIDRRGITVGGQPIPAPIDPEPGITIRGTGTTDDIPRIDLRLIALGGISVDDNLTTTTHRDGTITVHETEAHQ